MNFKKIITTGILTVLLCGLTVFCYADDELTSEFEENFNDIKLHISYNGTSLNSIINSGRPVDGDYSNTAVYPNGEESIYEGNAANNLYVYDSKGNKVYGGIEGFVGYYSGASGDYNQSNRRLTVRNDGKFADNKVLGFEPSKSGASFSAFAREQLNLSGISIWESDVVIATPGSGSADEYSKFGLSLTKNPVNSECKYEETYPIVQFMTKNQAANSPAEIYALGKKICDIKVISMYSTNAMYTVKYVLDTTGDVPMHRVTVEYGGKVVGETEPEEFENYEEFFEEGASYGILYRADSVPDKLQPRYLLDNIKFHKGTAANITNAAEIESSFYPLDGSEIIVEADSVFAYNQNGQVVLEKQDGTAVDAQFDTDGTMLRIWPGSLEPQTAYTLKLKNIGYGSGMFLNKEFLIKSMPYATVTNAGRNGNIVSVTVKNNVSEEKNYTIFLTAVKNKMNIMGGVCVKTINLGSLKSESVNIELNAFSVFDAEDVNYNVYLIDSTDNLHSVANKYIF